jgi:hypothetical protein
VWITKGQTHREVGTQSHGPHVAGPPDCRSIISLAVFLFNYSLKAGCKNFSVSIVKIYTKRDLLSSLSKIIYSQEVPPELFTHMQVQKLTLHYNEENYEKQIFCTLYHCGIDHQPYIRGPCVTRSE